MSDLGQVRRSQVLSTNGPGAIVDFRGPSGAPVSAVAAGIDEWDRWSQRKGLLNEQVVHEPRLEKKLGVGGFRLPPVGSEMIGRDSQGKPKYRARVLPAVRFPNWHVCPRCELLRETREWSEDPGKPGLYCRTCTGTARRAPKVWVVPVRLVVTCTRGHLSEFPWRRWVGHREWCDGRKHPLRLESRGAGLRGLHVLCTGCGGSSSLDGAMSPKAVERLGMSCSGSRPWLAAENETCDEKVAVLQRGASNVWFPMVESSLDIPPWGDNFQEDLGDHWHKIITIENDEDVDTYVRLVLWPDWHDQSGTWEELASRVRERMRLLDAAQTDDLRVDEYVHLTSSGDASGEENPEFETKGEDVPSEMAPFVSHLVRVERLREVRAMTGFTRVSPPSGEDGTAVPAAITLHPKPTWYPAVEVRGEGVFVGLDEASVSEWEAQPDVRDRAEAARAAALDRLKSFAGDDARLAIDVTPRFLLVHTLAHALVERLSLECGYSTASIRERLYVTSGAGRMCGALLYTSAPDADGTLGGLSREGRADRFMATFMEAIRGLEWCSSDPLCSSGTLSLSDGSNLAACHSCVFVPETTCEHFNAFLDRAMLVGTPSNPEIGFFRDFLEEVS